MKSAWMCVKLKKTFKTLSNLKLLPWNNLQHETKNLVLTEFFLLFHQSRKVEKAWKTEKTKINFIQAQPNIEFLDSEIVNFDFLYIQKCVRLFKFTDFLKYKVPNLHLN